jgi:hypothetical protein
MVGVGVGEQDGNRAGALQQGIQRAGLIPRVDQRALQAVM